MITKIEINKPINKTDVDNIGDRGIKLCKNNPIKLEIRKVIKIIKSDIENDLQ